MTDTNGSDAWEIRYHEIMWKMLEKALANKTWCDNEDAFTIALIISEKDYQKSMYYRKLSKDLKKDEQT